ncbi:hypothetical protein EXIGLDRAFT_838251 [Exidia glandulosa HHB12029]|uniref:Uncharacterized protein n=1 Tax=Exidia glandulosa HHB12029 TaxID=1314781 RepID=A0A165G099_EXIGL|nr:hypothetical protein EXIGLDRAFT_838251 [Exidia glandulosa HHB12029]
MTAALFDIARVCALAAAFANKRHAQAFTPTDITQAFDAALAVHFDAPQAAHGSLRTSTLGKRKAPEDDPTRPIGRTGTKAHAPPPPTHILLQNIIKPLLYDYLHTDEGSASTPSSIRAAVRVMLPASLARTVHSYLCLSSHQRMPKRIAPPSRPPPPPRSATSSPVSTVPAETSRACSRHILRSTDELRVSSLRTNDVPRDVDVRTKDPSEYASALEASLMHASRVVRLSFQYTGTTTKAQRKRSRLSLIALRASSMPNIEEVYWDVPGSDAPPVSPSAPSLRTLTTRLSALASVSAPLASVKSLCVLDPEPGQEATHSATALSAVPACRKIVLRSPLHNAPRVPVPVLLEVLVLDQSSGRETWHETALITTMKSLRMEEIPSVTVIEPVSETLEAALTTLLRVDAPDACAMLFDTRGHRRGALQSTSHLGRRSQWVLATTAPATSNPLLRPYLVSPDFCSLRDLTLTMRQAESDIDALFAHSPSNLVNLTIIMAHYEVLDGSRSFLLYQERKWRCHELRTMTFTTLPDIARSTELPTLHLPVADSKDRRAKLFVEHLIRFVHFHDFLHDIMHVTIRTDEFDVFEDWDAAQKLLLKTVNTVSRE